MGLVNLEDKCVLISGASKAVGHAIAKKFVESGATVYLMSKHSDRIALIAKEIDPSGKKAIAMPCELASQTSIEEALDRIEASDHYINVLINATDVALCENLEDIGIDEFNRSISINLSPAFLLSKFCFPMMKEHGGGHIINIASMISKQCVPYIGAYNAAKGGLIMLTRTIAEEWSNYNIRANTIINGDIELPSPRTTDSGAKIMDSAFGTKPSLAEDIAEVAAYLVSEKGKDVTGKEIVIDEDFINDLRG